MTAERDTMRRETDSMPETTASAPRTARNQAGGALVPVLSILTVLAVGVGAAAIYLQIQERDRRIRVEQDLAMAQSERESLAKRLADSEEAKKELEGDIALIRDQLKDAQDRMAKAVSAQEELARSVESREQEIGRLRKDIDQAKSDQQRAVNELADLKRERESAKQQLADLQQEKGRLEAKLQEVSGRSPVELDRVVVGAGGSTPVSAAMGTGATSLTTAQASSVSMTGGASADPKTTGQVVVINREYDFIVVNLGRNHGLTIGQEFQILRGAEVLGQAKVEKVYDELSAAALAPGSQKDNIREGDEVRAL